MPSDRSAAKLDLDWTWCAGMLTWKGWQEVSEAFSLVKGVLDATR